MMIGCNVEFDVVMTDSQRSRSVHDLSRACLSPASHPVMLRRDRRPRGTNSVHELYPHHTMQTGQGIVTLQPDVSRVINNASG